MASKAGIASRIDDYASGRDDLPNRPGPDGIEIDLLGRRAHDEPCSRRDLATIEHTRGHLEVLKPAICARTDINLVHRFALELPDRFNIAGARWDSEERLKV